MVTGSNKSAKYYSGKINTFDPLKWNTYNDATGKYLVKMK